MKPPMTRKEFVERAARGVVGPAVGLLDSPANILEGKRDICLCSESLINLPPEITKPLQNEIDEGRLGYVILNEGLTEIGCWVTHRDDVELNPPERSTVHASECTNPPRKDFSRAIFYNPAKVTKERAVKLRDFLESDVQNPVAIGRLLGYSEDDICAFYKQNHNYGRCMVEMNAATKAGVCAPADPAKENQSPAA